MNCDEPVVTREEARRYAEIQQKEASIQLLNWVLQVLGGGATLPMIRIVIHNKIVEIKGEGERA